MSDCMTQEDAMNMNNEQAIKILKPFMNMMRDQNGCPISDAYFALGKAIDALEPQRMRGKWIKASEHECISTSSYVFRCSECGETFVGAWSFCPNCGADMRGTE